MTVSYIEYELQSGHIMNWLVAGPQEIPSGSDFSKKCLDDKQQISGKFTTSKQEISGPPVERGPLHEGVFSIGAYQGEWSYFHCREDHLVDLSSSFQACAYVRAWAYTQLLWEEDINALFTLNTEGPVDIWVNKKLVLHYAEFPDQRVSVRFDAPLSKGMNKIMARFANVASPQGVLVVGLKIATEYVNGKVCIPTLIPSIDRRNQLETIYDQLYLERDIHVAGDAITLVYPESLAEPTYTDVRLQTRSGRIYGQAEDIGKPGVSVKLGSPPTLPNTTYQVLVMPRAWEFYESHIRITRRFDLWSLGRQRFSAVPYGYLDERRKEALSFASTVEDSLFSEIAKIALGKWDSIEPKIIQQSFEHIEQRRSGSEVELLGLLGVLSRHGAEPQLPDWIKEKAQGVALNFWYSEDDFTSFHTMRAGKDDFAIVLNACAILAGQLFPEAIFKAAGISGKQLRQNGEASALSWMKKRGGYGFAAWDSKELYSHILTALSYLIDLAQTEEIWELGSVLMDKLFFTIALNSYKGVYGSTQGHASTTDIKSGLLEPTSGITRLMWGVGIFNLHIAGTVSLACMANYELPPIIAEIAVGLPEELLNKEQQASSEIPVNKITYKTPDYMLSSAQSYRSGQPGEREHIWQATLGPQSIVFVNHPGCSIENDAHTPNFWLGNGALPRVAQCENTLVALYNIPDDASIDFTHAYFPIKEFDEFIITGNTAFARKDEGYIALTAANGLEQLITGKTAFREIRSPGKQNVWICQMGRTAVDGDFNTFQEKVIQQEKTNNKLNIKIMTLKGDILLFGWDDPLLYNDQERDLSNYAHYENPFSTTVLPCQQMDISTGEFLLRLKFDEISTD